ncbi:MAG: penicillin acylase family protein, partial [Pseudomonadota bacterium]
MFQWLVRITAALIILSVSAVGLIYYFAARSLPDYDATISVPGLQSTVEIVRDNANVPHIFADRDDDVFYGLGYSHAQDRLWQMLMLRQTVQGRLSEIFGRVTLDVDTTIRRFDLYNLAVRSFDVQDERTKTALRAYARGVNTRLQQINDDALGRGAPELFAFSVAIAPWQPADSIAVAKLMALDLT